MNKEQSVTGDFSTVSIILVRPNFPENVGFVARSMKSMGFYNLVLVDPGFPLTQDCPAYKTASGSHEVLDTAKVYRHLEEAIADVHHVIGFSRRSHAFERPQMDLIPFMEENVKHLLRHRSALVFGAEDYGLSNAEKQLCKKIVTIPMKAETMSLNLSHAVTVVLYEFTRIFQDQWKPPVAQTSKAPARHQDIQRVVNQLVSMLEPTAFFKEGRKEKQTEELRNLIQKMDMDESEYNTVMGMLNALLTKRGR